MKASVRTCSILFVLCQFLFAASVYAQATRTWVSGVGDDANPCSRTAPCKTFAGAISKTASPGEIDVLDPGGFGAVTITKSITIDGGGFLASTLASGVNGIIVNAPAGADVILRNLSINGAGTTLGINGVRFLSGRSLRLDNCKIFGFSGQALDVNTGTGQAATTSSVFVSNSDFRNNCGGAVCFHPTAGLTDKQTTPNTVMQGNLHGVRADNDTSLAVQNSVVSGNTNSGFTAVSSTTTFAIDGSVASGNGTIGVDSQSSAIVRVSNTLVTRNATGLSNSGGTVESFGNNRVRGNTTADTAGAITPVSQQ